MTQPKKSGRDVAERLPIKLNAASNGEYWPISPTSRLRAVIDQARNDTTHNAAKLGISRRDYLSSSAGAACVLLGMNQLGCGGGSYNIPKEAPLDLPLAEQAVGGHEFIIDVQTHQVSAVRPWWEITEPSLADFLKTIPQAQCGAPHWARCFTDDELIRDVYLESDTQVAVLSGLWGDPNPMSPDEAARTRDRVQQLGHGTRLLTHGIVQPNNGSFEQVSAAMHSLLEKWNIDAWKLYTVWGPDRVGYRLNDDVGLRTIQHGLDLGKPIFAVHKGLPLPGMDPNFTSPLDVGPTARQFPNVTFLIYHSGWESEHTEGPYDPKAVRGVDALIRSCLDNGVGRQGNVYAELGSTWRELMKKPDQAAHVLGKLLTHLGEDRILWGTDAIWYGSPQDQIQAFRAFEISPEFQEKYGYPALTAKTKAKIFGLNAARVYGIDVTQRKQVLAADTVTTLKQQRAAVPSFETRGPITRREMLSLLRASEGRPD
jgi:predicted TIM-barrel fold metal-dependent hydrolase